MLIEGSCLCGGVAYEAKGPLITMASCHCVQCRKSSGHYFASTDVPRAALTITGEENVTPPSVDFTSRIWA